jgi:hypothetical protein
VRWQEWLIVMAMALTALMISVIAFRLVGP